MEAALRSVLFGSSDAPFNPAQLFAAGAQGAWYDPSSLWGAADHLPRRNLLTSTATLATQSKTVTAVSHTLYIKGTGSVTLSGAATGTLSGTGASDRVSLVFTPTAGSLTLTVSGTVTEGHLTITSTIDHSYQSVTDWTTEQYANASAKNVPWLRRNRFLNTATLSTQTVSSVTATPLTVSFKGTGTITFSTAYSGSLVGTGANDRVSVTFTPSAGNLVCTVTGTVTEAQCEVGSTATTYQAVGASWEAQYAANAAAAGVTPTMYTDSAGTTPVTGPDSVVGVLGDLAQGYTPGSELVTNGDFSNGTTGWFQYQGTISSSGGIGKLTATASDARLCKTTPVVSGKTYAITFTNVSKSAGTLGVYWNSLDTNAGAANTLDASINTGNSRVYIATATSAFLSLVFKLTGTSGDTFEIDNLSVKELPGYHAIQSGSTGLKPTLRLNPNGYWWIQRDLIDDALVTTFPNLGANCVSYINDGSAVTETTGVTLNGALTQNTPAADYGRIYLNAPSSKSASIIKWLKAKAGLA